MSDFAKSGKMQIVQLVSIFASFSAVGVALVGAWGTVSQNGAMIARNSGAIEDQRNGMTLISSEIRGYLENQLQHMRGVVIENDRRLTRIEARVDLVVEQNQKILKALE